MKKIVKVLSVITIILMLVCISTYAFAAKVDVKNMDKQDIDQEAASKMETIGGTIVAYVRKCRRKGRIQKIISTIISRCNFSIWCCSYR